METIDEAITARTVSSTAPWTPRRSARLLHLCLPVGDRGRGTASRAD